MIHEFANGDKVLKCFLNFEVDRKLLKYQKKDDIAIGEGMPVVFNDGNGLAVTSSWSDNEIFINNAIVDTINSTKQKKSLYDRIRGLFISDDKSKKKEKPKLIPPDVIFKMIKSGSKVLEYHTNRVEQYKKLIESASENGQVALKEKLERNLNTVILESELYAIDNMTFIDEETIIEFAEKCMKGLRLDWIKNFTRIIPEEVATKKREMDELCIFDNYLILHYDPEGKATELTQEEIERKRDPILFGVIKGSRRLYFIDDWIDELCDLTLEEIASKVSISELTANPIEVKKTLTSIETTIEVQ